METKKRPDTSKANPESGLDKLEASDLMRSSVLSSATAQIIDAFSSLKTEAQTFDKERQNFSEVSKKLDNVHFPAIIKLDVGGQIFKTSMETLKMDPDSMLALMFSGRFELTKDKNEAYFIDRDGTHFRHILNFLRTGTLLSKDIKHIRDELLEEAEFYQIGSLILILTSYFTDLKGSVIITKKKQLEPFDKWFTDDKRKWKLVYSGSKDGWEVNDFHKCCDSYKETLVLFKSEYDHIFGGYAANDWSGNAVKYSANNFLFSIRTVEGTESVKFNAVLSYGCTHCHPSYSTRFYNSHSGGYDLVIGNKPNEGKNSTSTLGQAFTIPGGISIANASTFLAGGNPFLVKEFEVFALDKTMIV